VPIDVDLIEPSLLTKSEREWVNDYHKQVRAKIGPELADDGETREWLERTTRPI
jgi:Xaa-Pro aminopeptidase